MNERQEKIANRADKLQDDLQSIINIGKKVKGSNADYIDFVTAFFIHRIAALEIELEILKK